MVKILFVANIVEEDKEKKLMESFPRQNARTRRFTIGAPRSFSLSAGGDWVTFLQSNSGNDPLNKLWAWSASSGQTKIIADLETLIESDSGETISREEQARRERVREIGAGIVSYSANSESPNIAFASNKSLFKVGVMSSEISDFKLGRDIFDPQISPSGNLIAYVSEGQLRYVDENGNDHAVTPPKTGERSFGVADFIAAEEMGRRRGYWWSPNNDKLLATSVDESNVLSWHILKSSDPSDAPVVIKYPKAGTKNPDVGLAIYSLDGESVPVNWSQSNTWEYLVNVQWTEPDSIFATVQTRDQKTTGILHVNTSSGSIDEIYRWEDDCWVEIIPGAPKVVGERVVTIEDHGETRRIMIDGRPCSPKELQIRSLIHCGEDGLLATCSPNPLDQQICHVTFSGETTLVTGSEGVHEAVANSSLRVVQHRSMDFSGVRTHVYKNSELIVDIEDYSETPNISLNCFFHKAGELDLETVLLLPTDHDGASNLPVLLDPYGGPHAQRVRNAQGLYGVSQWFADQGFAVVVTDGRGTPSRSPTFEREVYGDLATYALTDQIDALHSIAGKHDFIDLDRVAIRGWSFGGYLAALAVIRRPDVFHAAVAGAPVTDWSLYDTHYTERYLNHPETKPENYAKTNLCNEAHKLERPLLLIHGLADDNVVAAHTFQLSQALLEAGKPHEVLPLTGVTHMTPQETVAENLLRIQLSFIQRSLGIRTEGNE